MQNFQCIRTCVIPLIKERSEEKRAMMKCEDQQQLKMINNKKRRKKSTATTRATTVPETKTTMMMKRKEKNLKTTHSTHERQRVRWWSKRWNEKRKQKKNETKRIDSADNCLSETTTMQTIHELYCGCCCCCCHCCDSHSVWFVVSCCFVNHELVQRERKIKQFARCKVKYLHKCIG